MYIICTYIYIYTHIYISVYIRESLGSKVHME